MTEKDETKVKEVSEEVEQKQDEQKEIDLSTTSGLVKLFRRDATDDELKSGIAKHISLLSEKHKVSKYKILLLYDISSDIADWHSNRIYEAASTAAKDHDILLILYSGGGRIEPAYLISKTCKRLSKNKFIVSVPRKAKSAATLLALGADEIHMGLMSELGPIDPQIGGFPALGMQNALNLLADLSCKYPGCSEMMGKYLAEKLDLRVLGYFERVSESAVQYAERLLSGKPIPDGQTPNSLADHFVNHYKDHGFVIDADEATNLLGEGIIKQKTKEYAFANEVYTSLDFLRFGFDYIRKQEFDYVGTVSDGLMIRRKKDS